MFDTATVIMNFSVLLGLATIFLQGGIVLLLVNYFFIRYPLTPLYRHTYLVACALIVGATAASLVYSDIVGFIPCTLCWYQRVFLYPQIVILGLGWWFNDRFAAYYAITLSAFGAVVALYQHALQVGAPSMVPCNAGGGVSCSDMFFFEFGYITFPLMSFTLFTFIMTLCSLRLLDERARTYATNTSKAL